MFSVLSMAQVNSDGSTLQFDAGSEGKVTVVEMTDFDKDVKNGYIIKEDDSYYFFLYDYATSHIEIFDDKYWIKLFMGKTIEDVQTSYQNLNQWYKKAKKSEYISVTNPNGQKVIICKYKGNMYLTYGTIDDVITTYKMVENSFSNDMLTIVPVVGLLNSGNAVRTESEAATYIRAKIADGTYCPTNAIGLNDIKSAVKTLQSNKRRVAKYVGLF